MNKELILELFYSTKGDIDRINEILDKQFLKPHVRKISLFEKFIKSRLAINPKVLKMAQMEVTPEEAVYLSLYPALEPLEVLDLRKNHIGDEGLEALAQSPVLINLREMDLRNNQITRTGMLSLAQSGNFSRLERLDLRTNQLAAAWAEKLKRSEKFSRLQYVKTQ